VMAEHEPFCQIESIGDEENMPEFIDKDTAYDLS
jgi:hypothetical protein